MFAARLPLGGRVQLQGRTAFPSNMNMLPSLPRSFRPSLPPWQWPACMQLSFVLHDGNGAASLARVTAPFAAGLSESDDQRLRDPIAAQNIPVPDGDAGCRTGSGIMGRTGRTGTPKSNSISEATLCVLTRYTAEYDGGGCVRAREGV